MRFKAIATMSEQERTHLRERLLIRRDELGRYRERITLEQSREANPVTAYDVIFSGSGVQMSSAPVSADIAEGYTDVMREGGLKRREAFLRLALMMIDAQITEVEGEMAALVPDPER